MNKISIMSVNKANPPPRSKLEVLRQRNAELEAELEAERERWCESATSFMEKIIEFIKKIGDLSAENFDLKRENQ